MTKRLQLFFLIVLGVLIFRCAYAQEFLTTNANADVPWAWYVSRASGFVAFALLYFSVFLGLTLRIPFLRKMFAPGFASNAHCWISLQATLFVVLHAGILLFDNFFHLGWADLFVPFVSSYETGLMALGIFGFYLMVLLLVTSYARKYISQTLWRTVHFMNIVLYVIVLIHIMFLGTDMKNPVVFDIFLWANAFLIFLMLTNMQLRISNAVRVRKISSQ